MAPKIAAGNWKMNGTAADLGELSALEMAEGVETIMCLPATLISRASGTGPKIGGQDCHAAEKGAHTGDISVAMLADAGATHVIVGHSERRVDHAETSADVEAKAKAALTAGLTPIICVGETLEERNSGRTLDVIRSQVLASIPEGAAPLVVAYEPVWAIGTGLVPTTEQIAEVHADIRATLGRIAGVDAAATPLLYGGSVKAGNAAEIFSVADVDGALVGGASLKASDFNPIIAALSAA